MKIYKDIPIYKLFKFLDGVIRKRHIYITQCVSNYLPQTHTHDFLNCENL